MSTTHWQSSSNRLHCPKLHYRYAAKDGQSAAASTHGYHLDGSSVEGWLEANQIALKSSQA